MKRWFKVTGPQGVLANRQVLIVVASNVKQVRSAAKLAYGWTAVDVEEIEPKQDIDEADLIVPHDFH